MTRAGFAGLLGATAAIGSASFAAAQPAPGRRVDVHHHCLPSTFEQAVAPQRVVPFLAGWTPERSFADMDAAGVAKAILSLPRTPFAYGGDIATGRRLARQFNEFMAETKRAHPQRFSFWADVPLPDVDGSIAEAAYALDHLGADGIAVATSYGKAWLGDPSFAPLWEMLNRRKAVVFTHPLANQCCSNQIPGVADTTIEYGTDTTRTIASLIFGGTTARNPDVNFIFAHAGGTMPFLIDRFRFQARDPKLAAALPHGIDFELRKQYYETAQAATPEAIGALTTLVPITQVFFGTDFPYRKGIENVEGLARCGLSDDQLQHIGRQNITTLLGHA